jgi:hypothetical protein
LGLDLQLPAHGLHNRGIAAGLHGTGGDLDDAHAAAAAAAAELAALLGSPGELLSPTAAAAAAATAGTARNSLRMSSPGGWLSFRRVTCSAAWCRHRRATAHQLHALWRHTAVSAATLGRGCTTSDTSTTPPWPCPHTDHPQALAGRRRPSACQRAAPCLSRPSTQTPRPPPAWCSTRRRRRRRRRHSRWHSKRCRSSRPSRAHSSSSSSSSSSLPPIERLPRRTPTSSLAAWRHTTPHLRPRSCCSSSGSNSRRRSRRCQCCHSPSARQQPPTRSQRCWPPGTKTGAARAAAAAAATPTPAPSRQRVLLVLHRQGCHRPRQPSFRRLCLPPPLPLLLVLLAAAAPATRLALPLPLVLPLLAAATCPTPAQPPFGPRSPCSGSTGRRRCRRVRAA